jgi:hypothetical protein
MKRWTILSLSGLLLACGVEGRNLVVRDRQPSSAVAVVAREENTSGLMQIRADERPSGRTGRGAALRFATPELPALLVIRAGTAAITVDSLEPALAAVRQLTVRVGGYIANTTLQSGQGQLRSATLDVKVPAARFDDALSGLQPIGKVEAVNVTAEDVGEEYVDVTARVENARRLEQRLLGILATRTGKLRDVIEVEQELARVREDIERQEGRLRYLRAHAATSSLAITVHEPIPVVGVAGTSPLGEAARQAWRNFVGLLALLIQSLGVLVPLGLLALGSWPLIRRARRVAAA